MWSQLAVLYGQTQTELSVGIFPRRNATNTKLMFDPLTQYLSKELGVQVTLKTPSSFPEFWDRLAKREFDIVHLNQYQYIKAHKTYQYDAILKNIEFGEDTIAGAILVRKDSGINTVTDLKNKVISFGGDRTAMQSYIIARYLLQQNGLQQDDYIELFAKNPPNAIMTTYFKQSAAAGSGDKVLHLKMVKSQININEMKYLVRGEQLAHLPWAIKSEMSAQLKQKIINTLLTLGTNAQGKTLLKKMALDGFSPAKDSDYDPHRKIILEVLKEEY